MEDFLDLPFEIGKRIRSNRELKRLSREELAEAADVSVSFLSDIEHGRKSMTTTSLYKVCQALGVSADYLLFGREAVTADNLSRAFAAAAPAEREHLEQLLFTAARLIRPEGENTGKP